MSDMTDLSTVEGELASVFARYSTTENVLDEEGLTQFWCDLGVVLDATEGREIYSLVAQDAPGQRATLKAIHQYLIRTALAMDIGDRATGQLLHRLLVAEREGRTQIRVKAFIEYLWMINSRVVRLELKKQIEQGAWRDLLTCSELAEVEEEHFDTVQAAYGGGITEIYGLECTADQIIADSSTEHAQKLKEFYMKLHQSGTNIWGKDTSSKFANLARKGANDETAMQEAGSPVSPVGVGLYSLMDIYHHLDGTLPEVIPQYVSVRAKWNSDTKTLHFSEDFDGVVPTEIATPDSLRYYNCSVANYQNPSVEILYAGHIHNFTYSADYLNNYVKADCGDQGASLERHAFPHLDCPRDRKSGVLVIGKYVDKEEEELQVTGFEVPPGQVVYIPPHVIHTNNYLKGTWTTMLSDQGKPIDMVHMVRGSQAFSFTFDTEASVAPKQGRNNGDGSLRDDVKSDTGPFNQDVETDTGPFNLDVETDTGPFNQHVETDTGPLNQNVEGDTSSVNQNGKNNNGQSQVYTQNTDVEIVQEGKSSAGTSQHADTSDENVMNPLEQDSSGHTAISQFHETSAKSKAISLQRGGNQDDKRSQIHQTSNTKATASQTQDRHSAGTASWLRDTFVQIVFSLLSAYLMWYMWANMM